VILELRIVRIDVLVANCALIIIIVLNRVIPKVLFLRFFLGGHRFVSLVVLLMM
jgi:hypothetical protein